MTVTAFASGTKTPSAAMTVTSTNTSDSLLLSAAHGLAVGDRVRFAAFSPSGTLVAVPTPLTAGTDYWVVNLPDTTHIKVSATEGGGAITMTQSKTSFRVDCEYVLANVNVAGVYELEVDLSALAAGDHFEFFVDNIALTGGTKQTQWAGAFGGVQLGRDTSKNSPPVSNDLTDSTALQFRMRPVRSASRAIPWKVLSH